MRRFQISRNCCERRVLPSNRLLEPAITGLPARNAGSPESSLYRGILGRAEELRDVRAPRQVAVAGRIVVRAPWLTQGYFKSKRTIQRKKRLLEAAHDAREPLVIDFVRCVALGVVMRVAVGRRVRHHQRMKARCPE